MLAFGFLVGFLSSFVGFSGVAYTYKPIAPAVSPQAEVRIEDQLPSESVTSSSTPSNIPTPTESATPISTPTPKATQTAKPTLTPTITPISTPTPTVQPVALEPTPTPDVWSPPDMDPLFAQFAGQFGVDKNTLERIAVCESHFNPNAANGDYLGMFQFSTSTWQNYRSQLGMDTNPALRTDITESIRTAAFMLSKRGTSAWPSCL